MVERALPSSRTRKSRRSGFDDGAARRVASQEARKSDELDLVIGRRIRERRMLLAISQEDLAKKINLSFQQLQKYETGENRISATRLFRLAQVLEVPITWFFR